MRTSIRTVLAGLILMALWAPRVAGTPVSAAPGTILDTIADRELGQPGLGTGGDNQGGLTASSLNGPSNVAVDKHTGRLYVADNGNNRVMSWPNAQSFTNGQAADIIIGQPNAFTNTANNGGLNASGLFEPSGVAVDGLGNLYVGDTNNNRVLIYSAPIVNHDAANVVLGQPNFLTNTANYDGVNANSLANPGGVAVDGEGNIYVANSANSRVLYYAPHPLSDADALSTIGQLNATSNGANSPTLNAGSLWFPASLAVDAQNNLYVADTGNNRVLEYDTPGTLDLAADHVYGQSDMTTNTPNVTGLNDKGLNQPVAVAVDAQNRVYVVDQANNRTLQFPSIGLPFQAANLVFGQPGFGSGDANHGGLITASTLSTPDGVGVDGYDNVLIGDFSNNRVLEYDTPSNNGTALLNSLSPNIVATTAGSFTLTVNGQHFVAGSVVRWNGSTRPTTYVSSTQIQAAISAADVAAGQPFLVTVFNPTPGGGLSNALGLPVYVRTTEDASADVVFGQPGFTVATPMNPALPGNANRVHGPTDVAVDRHSGRLFVSDFNNNRVLSWPSAASLANGQAADLVLGQPNFDTTDPNHGGLSAHTLNAPFALAVDGQGNLYVADSANSRVLVFAAPQTSGMAAHLVFGQGGNFSSNNFNQPGGTPTAGNLYLPAGVAVDGQGNLYVTDSANSRVLEFNAPLTGGNASRVFGQPTFITSTANSGGESAASLAFPRGLALDAAGNLFVADLANGRVLEYFAPLSTHEAASVVLGQSNFTASVFPAANASTLKQPAYLALDGHGNLFVADGVDHRVLEYKAPLTTHAAAQHVYGQPDVFSTASNNDGISRSSVGGPGGVALDGLGNLFVADGVDNRVLEYDLPLPVLDFLPLLLRQ